MEIVSLVVLCAFSEGTAPINRNPIYFEQNLGQFPPEVRFLARGTGAWTWITDNSLAMQGKGHHPVRIRFGPNRVNETSATGIDRLTGVSHYFHGNDPKKWIRNVPSFSKVKIASVYEGIDVVIYARQGGGIEYDFVVAPGADPSQITLRFETPYNAPQLRANGNIALETPWGSIQHGETAVIQDGKHIQFQSRLQNNELAFAVASYDTTRPLIVDPSVVYGTYIGGALDDLVKGMAVDVSGATYLTGQTASPDFPNTDFAPIGRLRGGTEAFVTKYALVSGAYQRVSSTYIGGSDRESGDAIALDSQGAAYIAGTTKSPDFPSVAALQTSIGGGDESFVLKISPAGNSLVYSTFFGGTGNETASGIAVDSSGAAYMAGSTSSTNLSVRNAAFTTFRGDQDGFLVKIGATPTAGTYPAVYATYFGGSHGDYAFGVAVDAAGSAQIVGTSRSTDLPTLAAFQSTIGDTNGGGDGYVAKFSATAGAGGVYGLVYSSFLGGSGYDAITAIAIDAHGNTHLAGQTNSPNFPASNSLSATGFTFVAKIGAQPTGSPAIYQPVYASLYAGQTQSIAGIAVDNSGSVHVAGRAYYSAITGHIPLVENMALPSSDGVFGFLYKLTSVSSGTPAILYSTYLDSASQVLPAAVGVDAAGIAYVASNHSAGALIAGGGSPATGAPGNVYLQRIAPTGGPNVSIDASTQGMKFTVSGAGCNPGEYTVPRTFTWTPGIDCIVTFTTPLGGESFGPPQHRFASWDNPTSNTNPSRTVRATATATTYRGVFDQYYGVQTSISPPGSGSTTPDLPCCPSATYFKGGSTLTITANPRPGYVFMNWTGNTAGMANPNAAGQTLTIDSWRALEANFKVDTAASISFVSNGPTVTFTAAGTGCGETFYEVPVAVAWREGTSCTVTTFARLGGENIQFQPTMPQFRFVNWDDGVTSLSRVIPGTNTAKTYRLNFDTYIPVITVIGGPSNGGIVNPPTGYQKQGASVTYTATANPGFRFTGWSGVSVSNPNSSSISIPIGTAATITATFAATANTGTVPITFAANAPGIPIRLQNCGSLTEATAPVTLNLAPGTQCGVEYAVVHIGPPGTGAGYQFLRWEDGLDFHARGITIPGVATTYNVVYKTFYSVFGLAGGDVGSGLVTPNERGYEPGQTATLTAAANTGYVFTGWTGTLAIATPNQTTISFVVNRSETVIANFAKIGAPTVSGLQISISGGSCRLVDTRNPNGPLGGPALAAKTIREFPLGFADCSFKNANAYLLNITVVPRGSLGYLSIWPTGKPQPLVSTLNALDGRVKANAAIVPVGPGGSVSLYATDTTDVIIDLMGIVTNALSNGMAFYPLAPCRISDSRLANGPLGGPFIQATRTRTIPVRSSNCNIPAVATAYSLNATVIPKSTLGFLTLFPTGTARPNTSVLNAVTGTVVANAAFIGGGQQGAIDAYVTEDSDLVLDINGYFAPPGAPDALYFYPVTPCRISDTRLANGPFGGPAQAGQAARDYPVPASDCGIPATAKAYSVNATVVPPGLFGFLTLWPGGGVRPTVSTLNAIDGAITSNAAIVPAGTGGAISAFGSELFHLLIDINGYFAP